MQYIVVRPFSDLMDDGRFYNVGDSYPADGVKASKARIGSLLNGTNKNGRAYIAKVEAEPEDN